MTYLENLHLERIKVNNKALKQGDGKAWDNVKTKSAKMLNPRGRYFKRFEQMESSSFFSQVEKEAKELTDFFAQFKG